MRKHILPLVSCILLLLTTVLPAFAAGNGSITVLFQHENKPVDEASFQIYQAAEWNGSGYTLLDPFVGYSVEMPDDANSDEWKTLASTLSAYAARDGITPLTSGQTDTAGKVRFDGLSDGLYLVTGSSAELDDLLLFPQPMLVTVPFTGENGTKDYEVVTEPKYDSHKTTEETVTRRALKIWKDDGNEEKRPQEVTVQLLCNGTVYDEQTLNEDNQWSYRWENLDAAKDWQLTEKQVPENYTVEITRQDITFTVTNTNDNSPPSTLSTTDKPTLLPQTGLLWWPVPVLGGIGAVALFFGIFLLLRNKEGSNA